MQPSSIDLRIVRLFEPLQHNLAWLDFIDELANNALVNGVVFAFPLFLRWRSSKDRTNAARQLQTIVLATLFGIAGSLLLQNAIQWPPPANYGPLKDVYALHSKPNTNSNSFPSDSAMLYSAVALGTAAWSRGTSAALFAWLLLFIAPLRILVGGHYPTDLVVGTLLGIGSLALAKGAFSGIPRIERLYLNDSPVLNALFFVWLFEVGSEFRDVRNILNTALHIYHHHL